jgi:hypothetical protein
VPTQFLRVDAEGPAFEDHYRFVVSHEYQRAGDRPDLAVKSRRGVRGGLGRNGELAERTVHAASLENIHDPLGAGMQFLSRHG